MQGQNVSCGYGNMKGKGKKVIKDRKAVHSSATVFTLLEPSHIYNIQDKTLKNHWNWKEKF